MAAFVYLLEETKANYCALYEYHNLKVYYLLPRCVCVFN